MSYFENWFYFFAVLIVEQGHRRETRMVQWSSSTTLCCVFLSLPLSGNLCYASCVYLIDSILLSNYLYGVVEKFAYKFCLYCCTYLVRLWKCLNIKFLACIWLNVWSPITRQWTLPSEFWKSFRFVEIMAPVFSRKAWRCVWHMIQVWCINRVIWLDYSYSS